MDNGELPLSWDKDELLGSDSEDDAEISDVRFKNYRIVTCGIDFILFNKLHFFKYF